MKSITTHVLDTTLGRPAANVPVTLEHQEANGSWRKVGSGATDQDGRSVDLLQSGKLLPGTYRLTFDTAAYLKSQNTEAFYPQIMVIFAVADAEQHYHIPLLLSRYGYSTYRGS
jgi:5-hydroxyisourate hydrolase